MSQNPAVSNRVRILLQQKRPLEQILSMSIMMHFRNRFGICSFHRIHSPRHININPSFVDPSIFVNHRSTRCTPDVDFDEESLGAKVKSRRPCLNFVIKLFRGKEVAESF